MKTLKAEGRVTFKVAATREEIIMAKQLCHDVYLEFGFINSEYPDREIPSKYEADSKYIIAVDETDQVVGTLRMCIGHSKTLDDWKGNFYSSKRDLISTINLKSSFEVEALAVRKDYRGRKVNWGLYKMAFKLSRLMKLGTAIIGMDVRAYQSLLQLGWHVVQIGPAKHYYGSMTIPALLPINIQERKVARRNRTYNKYLAA